MKIIIFFSLIFITTNVISQNRVCDYIVKDSLDKTYKTWHSPNYQNSNNTILLSFSKVLYTPQVTARIYLEIGFFGSYDGTTTANASIKFDDDDELIFKNLTLKQTRDADYHIYKNVATIELNGAQLYRFKTKKIKSFDVAMHYNEDLPKTFQSKSSRLPIVSKLFNNAMTLQKINNF